MVKASDIQGHIQKAFENKLCTVFTCRLKNDRGSSAGAITACSSSLIFIFCTLICHIKLAGFRYKLHAECVDNF